MEDIVLHFEERADRYEEVGTWVNNYSVLNTMHKFLPLELEGTRLLDIGSGTGAVIRYIKKNTNQSFKAYALDSCKEMLNKNNDDNIIICEADVLNIPYPDSFFENAVSRQCLHYIEEVDFALEELRRVVKNQGCIVLAQIVPIDELSKDYWKKLVHIRQPLRKKYFTCEEWKNLFLQHHFQLKDEAKIVLKGSLNAWIEKYNIKDTERISLYRNLLENAPDEYKKKYKIRKVGTDIEYSSQWFIGKFINNK